MLTIVLALVGFGLLMVYSASFIYAHERYGDGYWFIKRQLVFAFAGLCALAVAVRVPHRFWLKASPWLLGAAALSLVLVLIPGLGTRVGGAQRWFRLGGLSWQPGELAKFATIAFLARATAISPHPMRSAVAVLPLLGLLLIQPDFGSTLMIALCGVVIVYLGGIQLRWFFGSLAALAGAGAALILTSPYRMARLSAFLDPWKDPAGKGFQVLQSMVGFNNGKLLGVGLGNGKEKLFFLPEAHNDFIFAVIGEELGFVGTFVIAFAFLIFFLRGLRIARLAGRRGHDPFGMALAAGISLVLAGQAFINMAVVLGLLPTKGIGLPLVSYGGSALVVQLFLVGVLLSVARATSGATREA